MKVQFDILCCFGYGNRLQITYQAGIKLYERSSREKRKESVLNSHLRISLNKKKKSTHSHLASRREKKSKTSWQKPLWQTS